MIILGPQIRQDPLFKAFCLAHVNDPTGAVLKTIDPRAGGEHLPQIVWFQIILGTGGCVHDGNFLRGLFIVAKI